VRRLLLGVLLVLVAACTTSEPPAAGPSAADNAAAVRAVVEELRRGEEVVAVAGGYDAEQPVRGRVRLTITVPDGMPAEEQEAVLDRAEQLLWRSPVDPLNAVALLVREPGAAPTGPVRQRSYVGARQVAQLEDRYGPR
jgi:hypothetical protein